MTQQTPAQPGLTELLARFLNKQAQAHAEGLASTATAAEVLPYEAGPVQPVDTALAWQEAVAAATYFNPGTDVAKWPKPPHWASLATGHEPAVALAFCLGDFSQMVRDFHLILQEKELAGFLPGAGQPAPVPALLEWAQCAAARKQAAPALLALGSLRLAKNFREATAFQKATEALIPPEWRGTWNNEKAALEWHQGHWQAARDLWAALEPAAPVLFNRGMADLFLGETARGRASLDEAIARLPESSAWHHLARLYALLADRSKT